MKTILTAILLCIFFSSINAQKKDSASKTMIEAFQSKTGIIQKKEFFTIGDFKASYTTVSIEVLKISDVISGKSQAGVKFEEEISGSYSSQTEDAYLDADEVDDLLNFCLKAKDFASDVATYTEYNFLTKGNFKAYAYEQPGKEWTYGFYVNIYNSSSMIFFKVDKLDNLISLLQTAKDKLATIHS